MLGCLPLPEACEPVARHSSALWAQVWQGKLVLGSGDGCSASMQGLAGASGSLALIAHHVRLLCRTATAHHC